MSGKRVRRTRRSGLNFVLTVVAAVVVVGLLGWWITSLVTDDDGVLPRAGAGGEPSGDRSADASSSRSGSPSSSPSSSTSDSPSNSPSSSPSSDSSGGGDDAGDGNADEVRAALGTCVDQLRPVEAAVKAAGPGVASWRTHFQARSNWLAGRITPERLDAVFARSKHAGHLAAPTFLKAASAVEHRHPCAGLQDVASSDERVARCRARAAAATRALRAAERAMKEWGGHLQNMERFANGGMSGGQAQRLWVAAWRRGPAEVAAYRHGVHALRAAPACTAT